RLARPRECHPLHDRGDRRAPRVGGGAAGNERVPQQRQAAVGQVKRLLVPNRGEIAVRIARACRELGIESVLAFAEADDVRYVRRFFDDAVSLGSGDARETYLNVDRVIDAARAAGADALHSGYGFLSE